MDQRDDLHLGRTPRARRDGLTVRDLFDHFLTAKKDMMDSGEDHPADIRKRFTNHTGYEGHEAAGA